MMTEELEPVEQTLHEPKRLSIESSNSSTKDNGDTSKNYLSDDNNQEISLAALPSTATFASLAATTILTSTSLLIPPLCFSQVYSGLYRSAFIHPRSFTFLSSLNLRSLVYLGREAYPDTYLQFLQEKQIQFARFSLDGNKEPFSATEEQLLEDALKFICDSRNLPLLIHCHTGVHRTGCIIGIIRRMCGWSLTSIYDEYARMAGTTQPIRSLDRLMIEMYDIQKLQSMLNTDFIPSWLQ